MTYEQHCAQIERQIAANMDELRMKLQTMKSATDYALAIAKFVRCVMIQSSKQKLWADTFGLEYCVIVVPSQMYAIPVRILFSAEFSWKLGSAETIVGPECALPISFFHPRVLHGDMFGLQFIPDNGGDAAGKPLKRTHYREIIVRQALIKYIAEAWIRTVDTGEIEFDIEDDRCKAFLVENRTVLARIFGDRKYVDTFLRWYLFAISELLDVRSSIRSNPQFVYFIPGTDHGSSHPGECCFMFRRQLPSFGRTILRLAATRILEVIRLLDHDESLRRSIGPHQELSIKKNELHATRTALGTLRNKLHAIRLRTDKSGGGHLAEDIRDALQSHAEVLGCLDRIEKTISSSASYEGPLINLQLLQYALQLQHEEDFGRVEFQVPPLSETLEFDLLNPWQDLVESTSQFIEGGLAVCQSSSINESQKPATKVNKDVNVFMCLLEKESVLLISVKCKQRVPDAVMDALRSVTLFDRLPSKKEVGGRGILNAISTIRSQYRGICDCVIQDEGSSWQIVVPIKIVRQYELFRSASITIREFIDTHILKKYSLTFDELLQQVKNNMEKMGFPRP